MWSRKELKGNAKKILSKNYWKAFLVTLILITVCGAGASSGAGTSSGLSSLATIRNRANREKRNEVKATEKINIDKTDKNFDFSMDVDGKKINVKIDGNKVYINDKEVASDGDNYRINIDGKSISVNDKDGSVVIDGKQIKIGDKSGGVDIKDGKVTVRDGEDKVVFNGSIDDSKDVFLRGFAIFMAIAGVIMLFIMIIAGILTIFVFNPLRVGGYNYFNRLHEGTSKFTNIFGGFKHGHYGASVRNMFLKDLYEFLWSMLFIIPGIIKSYSYWMVPYLTADNPNLSASRAFEISKKTMKGDKWNTFVLQLSFIGWVLLCILSFGVGAYFLAPYQEATYAELYATLKQKAIANGIATEEELAVAA